MTIHAHQACFVPFLPLKKNSSSRIINIDDTAGNSSIILSYCYGKIICQLYSYRDGIQLKKKLIAIGIENIFIVVADEKELPYKNNVFSLSIIRRIHLSSSIDDRKANRLKIIGTELKRVSNTNKGKIYLGIEFGNIGNMIIPIIAQKVQILFTLLKFQLCSKLKINSIIFHYLDYDNLYFVDHIKFMHLSKLKNLYLIVKRLLKVNNITFIFIVKDAKRELDCLIDLIYHQVKREQGIKLGNLKCLRVGSGGMLIADHDKYIVRIPIERDNISAYRNFEAITLLKKKKLPFITPTPISSGVIKGFSYFIERKLDGISLDLRKDIYKHIKEHLIKMILKVITDKSLMLSKTLDGKNLYRLVDVPFHTISQHLNAEECMILDKAKGIIKHELLKNNIPSLITHGDFKTSNFIIDKEINKKKIALIDWENMLIPGLPGLDLLRFINHEIYGLKDDNDEMIEITWKLVNSEKKHHLLLQYCKLMDIPFGVLPALSIIFFIHHILNYTRLSKIENRLSRQEMITNKLIPVLMDFVK